MSFNRPSAMALIAFAMAAMQIAAATSTSAGQDQAAQADAGPDLAQIARCAKAWTVNCECCYNYRNAKEFSDKNWDVILNLMRESHARDRALTWSGGA